MRPLIVALYFTCAGGFIASLPFAPYTGSFIAKAIPILILLFAAVTAADFRGKFALIAAIIFSGAGDVILDLGFQGSFIAGLIAFLIAHLWYIGLFGLDVLIRRIRFLPTIPAVIFPLAMAVFLWPHLGPLKIPVAVYVTAIATMLVLAINRQSGGRGVILGASFFLASDTILALNKFYAPHPAAGYAIMATYYLAQYQIVAGILKEKTSIK